MNRQTVTVLRGAVDLRSGVWVETSRHDIGGCAVAPAGSAETSGTSDTVTIDATVYAPAAVDVRAADRILVAGELYDVVGWPAHWDSGTVIELVHHEG